VKRFWVRVIQAALIAALVSFWVSCGSSLLAPLQDLCSCLPLEPDAVDYRHAAKHVALPGGTPQEIDVSTIISWPTDPILPPDQPRFGRELQLVHISTAYLVNASVFSGDCDIHMEIAQTADLTAPRVIIETPVDSEYCASRQSVQSQLKSRGFKLDLQNGGDLPQPIAVEVLGLPFEDFEHNRGGVHIATLWEIHPAEVTFK
jgi:hypothetical protein